MTPLRSAWRATSRWPATAGALGIDAAVRWHRIEATDRGVTIPLRLRGVTTAADLASRADNIAVLMRCAHIDVTPNRERADLVSLRCSWTATPPSARVVDVGIPPSGWLVPPSVRDGVPLGVGLDGQLVTVPLFDPVAGASSFLVAGVPGSGKSNALRVMLAGLACTNTSIVLIDPTGGAEGSLWTPRLASLVHDADPQPTAELLRSLLDLIERRGRILAAGATVAMLSPVVLVCDELAELGAAGSPRQQDEVRSLLRRVVSLGRKANVGCVFATQRTTATSIDVTTRSLVAWRLALAHPSDRHGSEALLGPGRYDAAELSKADRGLGYLTDGGTPQLVQVLTIDIGDVAAYLNPGLGRSLDELTHWDEALRRELL